MDRRTINVALEEEVGLSLRRVRTRPFPINFVLDIAHRDERSHDASPFAGLCCSDGHSIVNEFCGRYTGATVRLRKDERSRCRCCWCPVAYLDQWLRHVKLSCDHIYRRRRGRTCLGKYLPRLGIWALHGTNTRSRTPRMQIE